MSFPWPYAMLLLIIMLLHLIAPCQYYGLNALQLLSPVAINGMRHMPPMKETHLRSQSG